MGKTLLRLAVPIVLSTVAFAQAERLVAAPGLTRAQAQAHAAAIVDLLLDDRVQVRRQALTAVVTHAPTFGPQLPRIVAMLRQTPRDELRVAFSAVAPFAPVGIDEVLERLSGNSREREVVADALRARPDEALAAIDRILAKNSVWMPSEHDAIVKVIVELAGRDRAAVVAAVKRFEGQRGSGAFTRAFLMDAVGAPEADVVDAAMRCFEGASFSSRPLFDRLLAQSAAYRERLAKVVTAGNGTQSTLALRALSKRPDLMGQHWLELRKGLGSSRLSGELVALAMAMQPTHPGVFDDVLAFVRQARPEQLLAVAGVVAAATNRLDETRAALAVHLTRDEAVSVPLLDALLNAGSLSELRAALPRLLAHQRDDVRTFAVQLSAVVGTDEAGIAKIAAMASDSAATVRHEVALLLPRMRGDDEAPLAGLVRDRDDRRVLAAYGLLRRTTARVTPAEEAALVRLANRGRWTGWLRRNLRSDFDAGRADAQLCRRVLGNARFLGQGERLWQGTPLAVAEPRAKAPERQRPNAALLEMAARNPQLRKVLLEKGIVDAEDVPALAEVEADARQRLQQLLAKLGSDEVGARSTAFAELQRLAAKDWQQQRQQLRRGGNRHQRRLLALLEQRPSRERALELLEAPEPAVVLQALSVLVAPTRAGFAPSDVVVCARALAQHPDTWREVLASSRANTMLSLTMAGEPAVGLVRAAFDDPRNHAWALKAAGLLGAAGREFLPRMVAALRTDHASDAAGAIFAIGIEPTHSQFAAMKDAIEAEWAVPERRAELLPAVAALGDEHDDFAEADYLAVLDRYNRRDLARDPGMAAWIQLGLRTEGAARRRIAMLVLATRAWAGAWQSGMSTLPGTEAWRAASRSPGLARAMEQAFGRVPEEDVRELLTSVLEAAAAGRPLPATASIVRQRADLVLALLRKPTADRLRRPALLSLLVEVMPVRMLRERLEHGATGLALSRPLLQLPPAAEVLDELRGWLANADVSEGQRGFATELLTLQGPAALPTIVRELEAGGARRTAMLRAMRTAGSRVEFAAEACVPLLAERPREPMLDALGHLGGLGLSLAMREIPADQQVAWLVRTIPGTDAHTAGAGLRLLQQLSKPAAERVARRMNSRDPELRRWIGFILLDAGQGDPTPTILALGRDPAPIVRLRAAKGLVALETWSEPAAVLATDLLSDGDPRVRRTALQAFAAHASEVAASRVALTEVRERDPDRALRAEAAALLQGR
jgi:hypothetical protein